MPAMHRYVCSLVVLVAAAVLIAPSPGQAGGPPVLSWSPSSNGGFDYGAIYPGQRVPQTLTLTNSGGSATGALTVLLSALFAFTTTADTCTEDQPRPEDVLHGDRAVCADMGGAERERHGHACRERQEGCSLPPASR